MLSFRNTACCAISLRRKPKVKTKKSSLLLADFRSLKFESEVLRESYIWLINRLNFDTYAHETSPLY